MVERSERLSLLAESFLVQIFTCHENPFASQTLPCSTKIGSIEPHRASALVFRVKSPKSMDFYLHSVFGINDCVRTPGPEINGCLCIPNTEN